MNIAIIAGHRKSNQGAYGNAGLSEFKMWTSFGKELVELLNTMRGVNAKFYQRQDKKGYTSNMIELHKRLDANNTDVAIELHFNGASNKKVRGHEILYYSLQGKQLAKMLNDRLKEYYNFTTEKDMPNRGLKRIYSKKQNGYQFLKRGKSVCILTEPFFSSHQNRFMKGTKGYDAMMSAYVDFVADLTRDSQP